VADPDDDISRLLRRMVDTMDRSTGEASRQAFAFIRTLGVIDDLVGQVDALDSEVAGLDERVRKLEKAGRKKRKKKRKKKKGKG
jgi:cell division protein ZapA (FtsZ GTPase activity inhibitor)